MSRYASVTQFAMGAGIDLSFDSKRISIMLDPRGLVTTSPSSSASIASSAPALAKNLRTAASSESTSPGRSAFARVDGSPRRAASATASKTRGSLMSTTCCATYAS